MKLEDCFKLNVGDRIVRVRTKYQNYDHTKIPTEPKVYTISWKSSGVRSLKENVQKGFIDTDGVWKVYTGEVDNRAICEYFETFENYISGNYNKDIILDKSKWNSLEEFLLYKLENDHKIALEAEAERKLKLKDAHVFDRR